MSLIMIISIGRRIASSACRRSLTSLYTIHLHLHLHLYLQMEQIFQSIYAYVIIVLSQYRCRCLHVYHLGLTTAPGKQLTGERRKAKRDKTRGLSRISCKQLLRWQRNNLCLRSYCLLPNVKMSKRLCVTRNKEV
jgi:hypothetical protein